MAADRDSEASELPLETAEKGTTIKRGREISLESAKEAEIYAKKQKNYMKNLEKDLEHWECKSNLIGQIL